MYSLWPDDLVFEKVKSPKSILEEQATFLSKNTNHLVKGKVIQDKDMGAEWLKYAFYLIARSDENYHYQLLTIYHKIDLYPVSIDVETAILDEIHGNVRVNGSESVEIVASSESEFLSALKNIFAATRTRIVIQALFSQADPSFVDPEELPF